MIPIERERDLHALLDGSASPAERARTEAWLATSDEGRRRRAELEELFAALAAVRPEPVPEGLRDDVLRAIRLRGPGVAPAGRRTPVRPRWVILAPLAAVLVAVAAYPWWRHALTPQDLPQVAGSLSSAGPVAGRGHWRVGDATVDVQVGRGADGLAADFAVRSYGPVELRLGADALSLASARFVPGDGHAECTPEGARLAIRADGDASFRVVLPEVAGRRPVVLAVQAGARRSVVVLPSPAPGPGVSGRDHP